MRIAEEQRELIMTGFYVGLGFWTASELIIAIANYIMEF